MSPTHFSLFLALFLSFSLPLHSTTPYLSPNTLFPNYQNMLKSFKVFAYTPPEPLIFSTTAESLFFSSLQKSPFITQDPEQAHLFFVPFSSHHSTRSLGRLISRLRNDLPFWNRTLGADHFYISCQGLSFNSDRNILELKKNSVQISCFPTPRTEFVPHKDITLPPFADLRRSNAPTNKTKLHLGFVRFGAVEESSLVTELIKDPDFYVESGPSDELTYQGRLESSKFCLFEYGKGDVSGISDAMRFGCVPVVMTDRPIQDLPLLDVLRWQDIAVFVELNKGKGGVKANILKKFLRRTWGNEKYEEVRGLCVTVGRHFAWNEEPQPYDAFHLVLYQLWVRRHVIRYARREVA